MNATVTIKITNVDETPTFDSGAKTVSVPENSTALWSATDTTNYNQAAETDVTYEAMDPEGRTVSYSLAGPDAAKFQLSGSPPVLSFASKPDFEAKASADRDNVYEVTVRGSVGADTGERNVRVTVGNLDEGPEISGLSTRNFVENSKDAVATFTAEDPEGATPIAWDIVEGAGDLTAADNADATHFTIDEDGMLKFSTPPDFENPSGEGTENTNTYKVVVVACDVALVSEACPTATAPAENASYHQVTVEVTKVDEPGKVTLATSHTDNVTPQYLVGASGATPAGATTLTATAEDGDITNATQTFTVDVTDEVTGVTWRWYRGGTLITADDAEDNTYTLLDGDINQRIRVVVTYQVDGNTRQESASLTTEYPVLAARIGDNKLKFDPATVTRTITEGDEDRDVGARVTAEGNHGTIRYSLNTDGDAGRFDIDEETGQITTEVELNYEALAGADDNCETRNSCTVTVTATDSTGEAATNSATVTINITDVDETPTFSTGAQTVSVPENSTALHGDTADGYSVATADIAAEGGVTYMAADPEGRTVTYSLAGPDASKFQMSGSPPVLSFVSKPDFEAKASADRDNVYEVTVRASVGSDTGEQNVRVTVSNVDEAPEITLVPASGLRVSGDSRVSVAEGSTAVDTYSASGVNAASARWTLSGTDAGDFRIGNSSGVLTFAATPDYESPADSGSDNVYMVTVTARDSQGESDSIDVTVTVTDVDDTTTPPTDLLDRYDADDSGDIGKGEMIEAINDYVFGTGAITKGDMIEVINLYLFG